MAMTAGSSRGLRSEINVTPLVDVVLVLLIIFMVVAPMLQRAKAVQLPRSAHIDKPEVEEEPLTISITADGKVWLGERVLGADFEARLRAAIKEHPDKTIVIKGDERLRFRDVREVMRRIRSVGAKGVGLGVEEQRR
jgi:biopolymer transport protein ExbD